MEITQVRIKLVESASGPGILLAYATVIIGGEIRVTDIKLLRDGNSLFISMPSRKLMDHCSCGAKNHVKARFCNDCGKRLDPERYTRMHGGRLHCDIVHPMDRRVRNEITDAVVRAWAEELELARKPSYVCRYEYTGFGDGLQ